MGRAYSKHVYGSGGNTIVRAWWVELVVNMR